MIKRMILLFLLSTSTVYAATECKTINVSSWTPDQRTWVYHLAYQLASQQPVVDGYQQCKDPANCQVCYINPAFNVNTTITEQKMLDRLAIEEAARQTARQAQIVLENEYKTLTAEIDADDANWAGMNTTQRLAVAKKLLRREVLKQKVSF